MKLTFRGGGTGFTTEDESTSDIKEEMLSVDWPLESRDDGAGGGGPRGLWIPPVNIRL